MIHFAAAELLCSPVDSWVDELSQWNWISAVACWRACQRALTRGPRLRAQEMRDLDTDRLEEGILAAQKAIKSGSPAGLQNLSRLILARARLNGYIAPQKMELTGKSGG